MICNCIVSNKSFVVDDEYSDIYLIDDSYTKPMSIQLLPSDIPSIKEKERFNLVLEELRKAGFEGLTINECALKTKMMRATADKYLNHILDSGSVILIQKGPAKIFLHLESAFFQLEKLLGKKSSAIVSHKQIEEVKKISAEIGITPELFVQKAVAECIVIQKLKLKEEKKNEKT